VPFRYKDTGNSIHLMDTRQMQRFRTRLDVLQHRLRLSIEHQLQSARQAEAEPDQVDQATSGYERASVLQRTNKDQQLLQMVQSAIGRIRDGSFGQCSSCGNEIGEARLEAVPWTPYCIECQEAFER